MRDLIKALWCHLHIIPTCCTHTRTSWSHVGSGQVKWKTVRQWKLESWNHGVFFFLTIFIYLFFLTIFIYLIIFLFLIFIFLFFLIFFLFLFLIFTSSSFCSSIFILIFLLLVLFRHHFLLDSSSFLHTNCVFWQSSQYSMSNIMCERPMCERPMLWHIFLNGFSPTLSEVSVWYLYMAVWLVSSDNR